MHLQIEISRSALAHNFAQVRKLVGECCLIAPCVKGNAYGHGLVVVASTLVELGANGFCVFSVDEGITLREAGIQVPILVLGYVATDELPLVLAHDFRIFLHDLSTAALLSELALHQGIKAKVHIKVDTGMGRFGVFYTEAESFMKKIANFPGLHIEGVASHFATADEPGDNSFYHTQMQRFHDVLDQVKTHGMRPSIRHIANSAATLRYAESHFDMVRPGCLIYGYFAQPFDLSEYGGKGFSLRPVMTVKTVVAQVKKVPAGTPIGYGGTFITEKESVLATLPVGYADGINWLVSNRGYALVSGQQAPIRGRVSRNAVVIDVTNISGVQVGDEVVLLGKQGDGEITLAEIASCVEIPLPSSVLTTFQNTIPRVLVD